MNTDTGNMSVAPRSLKVSENRIESTQLLGDQKALTIIHNNEDYTLRQTSNGKLILTK